MKYKILETGPVTIHGYGLMIAIGILSAILVAGIRAKRSKHLSVDLIYAIALVALIFGFIGAKLLYVIVELRAFIDNPMNVLSGSGFVVYGGIVLGTLAVIVYCRIKKVNFLEYFDLLAPSISIAQGFGRLGCLLAGCCYGRETDSIFGIIFHDSPIAPNNIKLIPTQIMSSAGNFTIAIMLIIFAQKNKKHGRVGALYLILYSVGRFIVEFFRNDFRGTIWFMSTSQFISIFILLLGLFMFFKKKPFFKIKDQSSSDDEKTV